MLRTTFSCAKAIALCVMLPALAGAQRGTGRTSGSSRPAIGRPVQPPAGSGSRTMSRGGSSRRESVPDRSWGRRGPVGRTYRPPLDERRPWAYDRWDRRGRCWSDACRCESFQRCNQSFAWASRFGLPFLIAYNYSWDERYDSRRPYSTRYDLYDDPRYDPTFLRYGATRSDDAELLAQVRAAGPLGAATDSPDGTGTGTVEVEEVGRSLLRLTWLRTPGSAREARLFVADSAQRPMRTQLVDAVSPSVLFERGAEGGAIAYVGVSVLLANGTIVTTMQPYRGVARRGLSPRPR